MGRYAGLEIDRDNLRMAIFEGSPKKFSLVDFIDEEIIAASDEERREIISGILTDLLSRKENRGMEIICGLDSRNVMLREISVPYAKDEMIAKTIRFEAESYLHSHAIEDVVIEYLKCSETESSSRLIICAALKEVLQSYFDDLKAVNVDPSTIEIDATALASTFANTPLYSGEQNVLLLEIEESYSRMVFLEKDRVTKIRSVWSRSQAIERVDRLLSADATEEASAEDEGEGAIGEAEGDELDQELEGTTAPPDPESGADSGLDSSIEERFQEIERSLMNLDRVDDDSLPSGDIPIAVISDDEYARLAAADLDAMPVVLAEDGEEQPRAVAVAEDGEPLERLFVEIERTFAAYVLRQPIDLIVVTGSQVHTLDAVPKLAERFEVDVVPFDLGDSFPIAWDGDAEVLNRDGAVACGLGLRALGKGFTEFDLRKDEFRFERRYQKMMPALTLTSILCAALTFFWAASCFYDEKLYTADRKALEVHHGQLFESFFERKPPMSPETGTPQNVLGAAKRRLDGIKKGPNSKSTKIKPYLWPLEMIQDVVDAAKTAKVDGKPIYPKWREFKLSAEVSSKKKSDIVLVLNSSAEAIAFQTALESQSKFFETRGAVTQKEDKGAWLVTVRAPLKASVVKERGGK